MLISVYNSTNIGYIYRPIACVFIFLLNFAEKYYFFFYSGSILTWFNWACRVKSVAIDTLLHCFLAVYAADELYSVQRIFF